MTQDHTKAIDESFLELGELSMYKSVLRKLVAKVTEDLQRKYDRMYVRFQGAESALNNLGYEEHGIGWVIQVAKVTQPESEVKSCAQINQSQPLRKELESGASNAAPNVLSEGVPQLDADFVARGESVLRGATPGAQDGPTPETDANFAFCRLVRDLEGSAQTDAIIARQFARSLQRRLIASQRECDRMNAENRELREQLTTFRDCVLFGRHQLEAPCLDNDQTNAVLGLFDAHFPKP